MLSEVLQIVADEIRKDEWKKLANYIGITPNALQQVDTRRETISSKMMKCFEIKNDNITWKFLKTQLQKINRLDLIEIIKNETLLTVVGLTKNTCVRYQRSLLTKYNGYIQVLSPRL